MLNNKGQFVKGERASPNTEFKPGQHWRPRKPFWDKKWLMVEYIDKKRSASDIAKQFGVTDNAILFWLNKHNIKTRSISETRAVKHWGLKGKANGMYGRRGVNNPRWKGGVTAERQAFYASRIWAKVVSLIWKRDKATCRRCGIRSEGLYKGVQFHIHHIVSFVIKEKRADKNNLILLCARCHRWIHSKKNKEREWLAE